MYTSTVIGKLHLTLLIALYLFTSGCKDDATNFDTTREIINNQGQKLEITFTNNDNNLTIYFQDKSIHLVLDTNDHTQTKYTNREYSYTNINGTTSLKKGDTILFIHNQYNDL